MIKRFTTVSVRCEDLQQRCFLYRALVARGVRAHSIDIQNCPRGKGDGLQFVRQQHVAEVRAMRAKPYLAIAVVSMVDADAALVAERKSDLDAALEHNGQRPRNSDEPITVLVPKRTIETWIHRLLGRDVDEAGFCARMDRRQRECDAAAKAFARGATGRHGIDSLPSLADGYAEFDRVF